MMSARAAVATLAMIAATAAISPGQAATSEHVTARQQPDQWTATSFIRQPITGPGGKQVGDVNDVVFNPNGKLAAIVGGFLGVGERNVAIPVLHADTVGKSKDDAIVRVNITKDALESAPPYEAVEQVGIVDKLFQQAKAFNAKVIPSAKTVADKSAKLGGELIDETAKLSDRGIQSSDPAR